MKGNKLNILILSLLMLIMFIPMLQEHFHLVEREGKPLMGSFKTAKDTSFTTSGWFDRSYQDLKEAYVNENFGFRNFFVRLKNETEFTLYDKINVKDVFRGKEDFLYSIGFYQNSAGRIFLGDRHTDSVITDIKRFRDYLKERNKQLLVCFVPTKEVFYPEYLPDSCVAPLTLKNYYSVYTRAFKREQINMIDFIPYFKTLKQKVPHPLFTQGAVHWTTYGAGFAMDTLFKTVSHLTGKPLRKLKYDQLEISDTARYDDNDIHRALNLLREVNSRQFAYPKFELSPEDNTYRPKVLLIGDSFFYAIGNTWMPIRVFAPESYFLYYYKTAISFNNLPDKPISEFNMEEEIKTTDVVILFFSTGTLNGFPYGSTGFLHK